MNLFRLFLPAAFVIMLSACQKESNNTTTPAVAETFLNTQYGADAQQDMDIYLPAGRSTAATKVMILIHGGAWSLGDKTDFSVFIDSLKIRMPGYAIFNINYRLSANPNNLFPTQENDVKAAFQFIYSRASTYLISDKYVLLGVSAGAHLALLQGYKYDVPIKPKAIISYCGPTDLTDMYNNPYNGNFLHSIVLASVIGKTPAQDPLLYTNSSPVSFINSTSPPTIFFHGDLDTLVAPSQSIAAKNLLLSAGVTAQYYHYPTEGHVPWSDLSYTDSFEKLQAFLTANGL